VCESCINESWKVFDLFSHGRPGSFTETYAMLATMRINIACIATMVRNMCHAVLCCDPVVQILTLGQQVTKPVSFKTTASIFPALIEVDVGGHRSVVMERARTYVLAWGNAQQQAILSDQNSSFDSIIGADVVYAPQAIASLFATCSALLSPGVHARLILCHIVRRVSEDSIIAAASAAGLIVAQQTAEMNKAMKSAVDGGPFRILVFCKRT
jgi:hypothetical protein